MGTNKIVMLLVGVLLIVVVAVSINAINKPKQRVPQTSQVTPTPEIPPDQPVVADGDTVSETLRDVVAGYEETTDDVTGLASRLDELEKALDKKKRPGKAGSKSEPDPVVKTLTDSLGRMKNDVQSLTGQINAMRQKETANKNGYQVSYEDLGIEGESGESGTPSGALPGYAVIQPMTRSSRLDGLMDSAKGGLDKSSESSSRIVNTLKQKSGVGDVKKVYTIPARATLFEGVAMTTLIGAVPIGGKVTDPFPAKFIVGENNLATNGLRIPGLKGIIFEGVARGNWNLSCVSVAITGGTYTFHDGRIQHLRFDSQGGNKEYLAQSPYSEGEEGSKAIGYISNPQGVPCIPGRRVTDAHRQMVTMGLLGAGSSYFDAKAAAETTTSDNPITGGGNSSVTGDHAKFINNTTYANTIRSIMQFYEERAPDTFDAIVTNPAEPVVFNITQDLHIDYNTANRKLAYLDGGSHVNQLD